MIRLGVHSVHTVLSGSRRGWEHFKQRRARRARTSNDGQILGPPYRNYILFKLPERLAPLLCPAIVWALRFRSHVAPRGALADFRVCPYGQELVLFPARRFNGAQMGLLAFAGQTPAVGGAECWGARVLRRDARRGSACRSQSQREAVRSNGLIRRRSTWTWPAAPRAPWYCTVPAWKRGWPKARYVRWPLKASRRCQQPKKLV